MISQRKELPSSEPAEERSQRSSNPETTEPRHPEERFSPYKKRRGSQPRGAVTAAPLRRDLDGRLYLVIVSFVFGRQTGRGEGGGGGGVGGSVAALLARGDAEGKVVVSSRE